MFRLAKNGTLVKLLRFSLSFLFACAAISRVNLALRSTIIEDTHLTLAVIPFKVEAKNSLVILPLQTFEKKLSNFVSFTVYNSLNFLYNILHFYGFECTYSLFFCFKRMNLLFKESRRKIMNQKLTIVHAPQELALATWKHTQTLRAKS